MSLWNEAIRLMTGIRISPKISVRIVSEAPRRVKRAEHAAMHITASCR